MTWVVECRRIARPSGEPISTGSMTSPSLTRAGQVAQLAVDPRGEHGSRAAGGLRTGRDGEGLTGRRARLDHLLASGESEVKRLR